MSGFAHRAAPVVLAAPAGTGKTTLARRLVRESEDFTFSVSATTRQPRAGEEPGIHYHFVDRGAFDAMVAAGELVEWAEVHGQHCYGTPRSELEQAAAAGRHMVLDIDVQGARQIRERVPEAVLIFVLPPTVDALMERLVGRGTEGPGDVARRLSSALDELRAVPEFDYVVVNDELDGCLDEIRGILRAEGYRTSRAPGLMQDVEAMRSTIAGILRDDYTNVLEQE